ncbi:MAG: hypothetical protein IPF92_05440 [Myxococcales bacterium]|nr:hypothetical protein [Myxococcales bacterium]MBL0198012.1 hypothetical protein [Myxococcales bacterium]
MAHSGVRWAFAIGQVILATSAAGGACTPVPIVGYDAAITADAEAGAQPLDAGDAEAAAAPKRREWDAGVDDDAFPASDEELELRMRHLLEAVAAGDPALAPDVLYPRDAWVRSRDASDPGKAWDHSVKPSFLRDVAKLHKRAKGIERARFVSFDLGRAVAHVPAKPRDLKRPLWRVKRSRITYTIDDKTKHLDIAEMTAFRGAWYVTRLR